VYLSRLLLDPRSQHVRRDIADCHQLHRTIMSAFPDLALVATAPATASVQPVALGTAFPLDLAEPASMSMPPSADARARLGVLHRVEIHPRTGQIALLVQSAARPDWSNLAAGYLASLPDMESAAVKPVADAYAAITTGDVLLFRLRANPTKRLPPVTGRDGVRRDGKRVDLRGEDEQLDWLTRKAADHGFELLNATVRPGLQTGQSAADPGSIPDVRASVGARRVGRRTATVDRSVTRQIMTFGDVLFEGHLRVLDPDGFRRTLALGIGSGKAYGFGLLSVARAPA
jgi:CRISPR system Cascade subunit CasE